MRRRGEAGSLVVELVVLTPVLFLFAVCILVFGRVSEARQQIIESARAGAQAAALMPDAQSAQVVAGNDAVIGGTGRSRICRRIQVITDVSHFYPGGYVRVTVACGVNLADLSVPGVPGSTTISESTTAPIDPYRSVQ
ncbi:MAG: TadE/TadG family type IV pilus assembly protein [Acidimicrobiales bacterium]